VQKAVFQPDDGEATNQIALPESVIRINDEQYWLYAAIDPAPENFHICLFPRKQPL
jgi:putative transposase